MSCETCSANDFFWSYYSIILKFGWKTSPRAVLLISLFILPFVCLTRAEWRSKSLVFAKLVKNKRTIVACASQIRRKPVFSEISRTIWPDPVGAFYWTSGHNESFHCYRSRVLERLRCRGCLITQYLNPPGHLLFSELGLLNSLCFLPSLPCFCLAFHFSSINTVERLWLKTSC